MDNKTAELEYLKGAMSAQHELLLAICQNLPGDIVASVANGFQGMIQTPRSIEASADAKKGYQEQARAFINFLEAGSRNPPVGTRRPGEGAY